MVRAQMLSELEEIIAYKQFADQPERQQTMRKTWMTRFDNPLILHEKHPNMNRLQGCQPDVEVWQRILQVRTLVLRPEDDPAMWIQFANLCRKSERMALAEKTINSLLSPDRVSLAYVSARLNTNLYPQQTLHTREPSNVKAPPNVVYAQLKYMWATGAKDETLIFLRSFSENLGSDIQAEKVAQAQRASVSRQKLDELSRLLARCYFKQGEWQVALKDTWGEVSENIYLTAKGGVTSSAFRGMSIISSTVTCSRPTTILHGTRRGIPGRWPILMSSHIWKVRMTTVQLTFLDEDLPPILYRLSNVWLPHESVATRV